MEYRTVIVDGQMMNIPAEDLLSPSKMRWWFNMDTMGFDPRMDSLARQGWHKYLKATNQLPRPLTYRQRALKWLQRKSFEGGLWLRAYWFARRISLRWGL